MTISVQVFTSLVQGKDYLLNTSIDRPNSYSHELRALGGYWQATITMALSRAETDEWIDSGLGRHVEVYNDAQGMIFEGFVNQVSASLGPLSVERGPLLDIANRVRVVYSTVDTSVSPPVFGVRAVTAAAEDATSQAQWGLIEKVLSTGGARAATAEQIRDTYLNENKNPTTTQTVSLGGGGSAPTVTLTVLGYVHWLFYVYSSTTTGTENLSTQIEAILGQDPNAVFSADYTAITENTLQVDAYQQDSDLAWELIKGLVAQGDSSDNRYIFGIYAGRRAAYNAIPTTPAYRQVIGANADIQHFNAGTPVRPWDVKPGQWLFVADFLPGQTQSTDLQLDPRMIFIETVQFTAPYGLQLQGGKADKLSQKLAKLGLSGVGA